MSTDGSIPYFKKNLSDNRNRIALISACIGICFLGIFGRSLWTPDEPRVAAISLEMSRSGDLVIPHLAGEPFIEKPPLYFAVAAGLIRTIGPIAGDTGAIRLASALFALGTLGVTFLLAKRLSGESFAILSMVILCTMVGFFENFHWIRVDAALSFFVAAAVWCLAEGYLANRAWFLPLAGIFTAGAFLSKGLIGPILIAIPWAGLFVIWLRQPPGTSKEKRYHLFQHGIGLIVFILVTGLWIVLLKQRGGPALWHEWFWVNHVGRLTGTATVKGHLHPGRPFYYLNAMVLYSLPWLPLVFIWLGNVLKRLWQHRALSRENLFLLVWGVGTIVFLSLSATKRNIYLAPALPAFAIMSAMALEKGPSRVFEVYTRFWLIICSIVLALLTGLPVVTYFLKESVPVKLIDFIGVFGFKNFISGIGLVICLYYIFKRQKGYSSEFRFIIATFVLYIGLITGPMQAIDLEKRIQPKIQEFAGHIATEKRPRVAGWNFTETMRGYFYYYCNWSVPQIRDKGRLNKILSGTDKEFDSVIISHAPKILDAIEPPNKIAAETDVGSFHHKRKIYWVKRR